MPFDTYPHMLIKHALSDWMESEGFALYCWLVSPGAFDCPIEPLTKEYWEARGSVLRFGIAFPGPLPSDRGDLVVLLVQKNSTAASDLFGDITEKQKRLFYSEVRNLPYPHVNVLKFAPSNLRQRILQGFEKAFVEGVLPVRDSSGNYKRIVKTDGDQTIKLNKNGTVRCPKCSQRLNVSPGIDARDLVFLTDGRVLRYYRCQFCGKDMILELGKQ